MAKAEADFREGARLARGRGEGRREEELSRPSGLGSIDHKRLSYQGLWRFHPPAKMPRPGRDTRTARSPRGFFDKYVRSATAAAIYE